MDGHSTGQRSRADEATREEVLRCCNDMVRAGLTMVTQGNVSVRLPSVPGEPEAILITPTGIRYDTLGPADLVVVADDGTVLEGDLAPSTELPVHLAHYRRRPDVRAAVHTESIFVNVLGVLGRRIDPVLLTMVLSARGPVPVMPFEFSTSAGFGRRSAELMGDEVDAVVWANHGLLAVGPTLTAAFKVAAAVEKNAEVLYHASLIGAPTLLDLASIIVPDPNRMP